MVNNKVLKRFQEEVKQITEEGFKVIRLENPDNDHKINRSSFPISLQSNHNLDGRWQTINITKLEKEINEKKVALKKAKKELEEKNKEDDRILKEVEKKSKSQKKNKKKVIKKTINTKKVKKPIKKK